MTYHIKFNKGASGVRVHFLFERIEGYHVKPIEINNLNILIINNMPFNVSLF